MTFSSYYLHRRGSGHSTDYRVSQVSAEGGVWVRAYLDWACGGRLRRYDVMTAQAAWLGCDREHAERMLREMCGLTPQEARVRRLRADQSLRERTAGCSRRGRLLP